ncbi:hypothetical protein OCU04_011547 [Sclerotinia nivalis]|uniref:Uncharacterized protein n=1 Tax=Sclerotinia nivalis TaxID=352851 RepID=A0A9X0DFN2_9HELO|nr:hypothetical protein OCU04_011547 [Sclerotinia nivalis]
MARQANHQKTSPVDQSKAHAAKSKVSKTKVSKVSKVISPPKVSRERTKECVLVKPIAKNEVRKLQRIDKHARSFQISKHAHIVEPSSQSDDLSSTFHESLEGARAHILNAGKAAFDKVHEVLIQKVAKNKASDSSFLENISHNAAALSAPLAEEKIETTVKRKSRRVLEVVEIGERVDQFRQTIESEENKLEDYWKQWESLQNEFVKFAAQVFGGDAIKEKEEDEGYRVDMQLLDADHTTQMNALLEEIDEVGHDAIKMMKASEKEIDVKADKVRQRIVGAMMW